MIYAVCAAFVVIYGLSAYLTWTLVWRYVDMRDKRERELLMQITNPGAAEAAAFHRALESPPPPHPDTDGEDDDIYGRDVTNDFDYIAIGDEA